MISSTNNTNTCLICFCYTFFICICSYHCSAKDSLTIGEIVRDGSEYYLESPGKKFQMGFFPNQTTGSERRYVGIWYTIDPKTVVWVANRDHPVLDSSGVLTVTEDGEIKVQDEKRNVYFNTETGGSSNSITILKLLDSGNAVLEDIHSGNIKWQTFLNPSDTFLPGMIMDQDLKLTSWKTADDPGNGRFVFQQVEMKKYAILNANDTTTYLWKSGSKSVMNFDPNPMFVKAYDLLGNTSRQLSKTKYCANKLRSNSCDEIWYPVKNYTRLLMNYAGNIQYFSWEEKIRNWVLEWQEPKDSCSHYQACGPFGLCSLSINNGTCSCLPGFEPIAHEGYSNGCKHKSAICDTNDEFINMSYIKVENPSPRHKSDNESDCRQRCLDDCRCNAYTFIHPKTQFRWGVRSDNMNSCWIWNSDLYNLQTDGIFNISIRVSGDAGGYLNLTKVSPPGNSSSFMTDTKILILAMAILVIIFICMAAGYTYHRRLVIRQQGRNTMLQMDDDNNERWATDLLDLEHTREYDTESIGVPFFQFESILVATNNFSDANKLGEGGFGPVFKGKLPGGLEVAVKRLSSQSGQGLQEFRNEVILIAKLQHRNLVRLLGYCMKGKEKMLLYEYMPNKSLDAFIFGQTPSISLEWAKRYEIILGIARGLVYLHQDSRLRIIHRDLKTSNVLLDEDLNPKISDFGLAKIVEGREMESSTNRVIGTYGYMAPEYALEGLFSIKSDVFSFGVVVLEIISGKKNTVSSQLQQNLSLLGYAWSLWKEDMPFELMDQRLLESSNSNEVLKCIIVGLLCVQEDPGNRPTMSNVVLMLGGDIASLPTPTQPAFVARKPMSTSSSSSYNPGHTQTNNTLTITLQEGR